MPGVGVALGAAWSIGEPVGRAPRGEGQAGGRPAVRRRRRVVGVTARRYATDGAPARMPGASRRSAGDGRGTASSIPAAAAVWHPTASAMIDPCRASPWSSTSTPVSTTPAPCSSPRCTRGLDLRAVTCVGGNAPLADVVRNTLAVLETAGRATCRSASGRRAAAPRGARSTPVTCTATTGWRTWDWPPPTRAADPRPPWTSCATPSTRRRPRVSRSPSCRSPR